jgi:DNA polymerase elongation subunit (family B)
VDTEISPHLTYTYDTYEADVVKMVRPQFFLSFQYKVLGSKKVHVIALPDFKAHYRKNPYSDELLVKEVWKILDKADVLIGHNLNAFDCKKLNARFAYWGLPAPSGYQTIDTLTLARGKFGFPGNSLAKLADYLNVPQQKLHFGIEQWIECIEGNLKTWKKEKEYGARDIVVTEQVYYKLRSYLKNHPHMFPDDWELKCHACGSQNLVSKGYRYLQTGGKKKRYTCKDCGTFTCDRKSINITSNSA